MFAVAESTSDTLSRLLVSCSFCDLSLMGLAATLAVMTNVPGVRPVFELSTGEISQQSTGGELVVLIRSDGGDVKMTVPHFKRLNRFSSVLAPAACSRPRPNASPISLPRRVTFAHHADQCHGRAESAGSVCVPVQIAHTA